MQAPEGFPLLLCCQRSMGTSASHPWQRRSMQHVAAGETGHDVHEDLARDRLFPVPSFLAAALREDEFRYDEPKEEVVVCEGVDVVAQGAFREFDRHARIRRIDIPSTVRVIGAHAFDGYHDRERRGQLQEVKLREGLEAIGEFAFYYCYSLQQVIVPRTVKEIGVGAFEYCWCLREAELSEGIREIAMRTFDGCLSLERVKIPSTLEEVGTDSFRYCERLKEVELGDNLVKIGREAFFCCTSLQRISIPSTVGTVEEWAFGGCMQFMSVELCDGVRYVGKDAFRNCFSLRNIAIPATARASYCFEGCYDLLRLFSSSEKVDDAMKGRFDGLPFHRLCYNQWQRPLEVVVEQIQSVLSSPCKPKGMQDCIGMTPLHILACSTKHNLDLYQVIVEHQPQSLVTLDKWGCLPMFYAIWVGAPKNIVQYIVDSQKEAFPGTVLDWNKMVETLCVAGASLEAVLMLLDTQRISFPDHSIDWQKAAKELTIRCLIQCNASVCIGKARIRHEFRPFRDFPYLWESAMEAFTDVYYGELVRNMRGIQQKLFPNPANADWQRVCESFVEPVKGWWYPERSWKPCPPYESYITFHFLVKCNIVERLNAIENEKWRVDVRSMIEGLASIYANHMRTSGSQLKMDAHLDAIHSKLVMYENRS